MSVLAKITEVVTPSTWRRACINGLMVVLLIILMDSLLSPFLPRYELMLGREVAGAVYTSIIAAPVMMLFMSVLYQLRRLQQELLILATTDVLTGLLNRRAFLSRADQAASSCSSGAVMVVDADHFKNINDTWGHAVGDCCLRKIAHHLQDVVGAKALVGRVGGEEFSVFIPHVTRQDAQELGSILCSPLEINLASEKQNDDNNTLRFTLSAGIALADRIISIEQLILRADHALYAAKSAGRARAVIWSEHQVAGSS